ncbi:MAG: FAD-dependent monooxygenase [Rhodospirillales bacterium]|nr:FAD-dependent monooxygenase [Rhodospirillales bacterium]
MSKKQLKTDILVSGGGMAGLILASLLGHAGLDVIVVDPNKIPAPKDVKPQTRTIALFGSSINILKAAGVWDIVEPNTLPIDGIRIIDDARSLRSQKIDMGFTPSEIGNDVFGHSFPGHHLFAAIIENARKSPNIRFMDGIGLSAHHVDNAGITATLDDGTEIRAALIAGADGRHSITRKDAALPHRLKDYGQKAITCIITHTQPHYNTAIEFHRPGGPFVILPQQDAADGSPRSSIVWVEKDHDAEGLLAQDKDTFTDGLRAEIGDILGDIELVEGPHGWPLQWSIAPKLTAPRVAILAEAAHTFTPLGAQGLNLSLRDIAALAETLTDARRLGQDIGSAETLRRYDRRRRLDVISRVASVNAGNFMVSSQTRTLRTLHHLGLKTIQNLPPLKRAMMRFSLSNPPDQGRLARGGKL